MRTNPRTAVVLAGGLGSRLRPLTLTVPKPLLPIGELPIIDIVLRQLAACNFERVVISLGHLGAMIEYWVGDGSRFGIDVEYLREDKPLGTAGALALIDDLDGYFLVLNGDLLTTFDYAAFVDQVANRESHAGVALKRRVHQIDYGVVSMSAENQVTNYQEKPSFEFLVSMGIYVLHSSVLEDARPEYLNMPDLLLALMESNRSVVGIESDVYWEDLGRPEDFERAQKDFLLEPRKFLQGGAS